MGSQSKDWTTFVMSRIQSKNTKPELIVRKFLLKNGFHYRLHVAGLPGKPDIVFRKYKVAIFVNGCFWHKHDDCNSFKMPKSNRSYWVEKIAKNVARDLKNKELLESLGWKTLVIWECQLKAKYGGTHLQKLMAELRDAGFKANEP